MAMKFRISKRDKLIAINPSLNVSLVGFVKTTYRELCDTFGPPSLEGADTSSMACQWKILFKGGVTVFVYAYHAGNRPGVPRCKWVWHVAGPSEQVVDWVADCLGTTAFQHRSTFCEQFERKQAERQKKLKKANSDEIPF